MALTLQCLVKFVLASAVSPGRDLAYSSECGSVIGSTYNAMNSLSFPYQLVYSEVSKFFHSNLNMHGDQCLIASHCNTSEFNLNDQVLSDTDFAAINESVVMKGYKQ